MTASGVPAFVPGTFVVAVFVWATLCDTSLIELLDADVREAFERASEALSNHA